jgi:hypothetical protein
LTKRVWRDAFGRFTAAPKRGTGELRSKPKAKKSFVPPWLGGSKRKAVKSKPEKKVSKAKPEVKSKPEKKVSKAKPEVKSKPEKKVSKAKPEVKSKPEKKVSKAKPEAVKPTPKLVQQRNRKTGQFQKAWIPADIEWVDPFPLGNHKRNGSYSRNYSRVRFHEDAARLHRSLEIRSELGRAELERTAQDMAEELGVHVNEVYSFFLSW